MMQTLNAQYAILKTMSYFAVQQQINEWLKKAHKKTSILLALITLID